MISKQRTGKKKYARKMFRPAPRGSEEGYENFSGRITGARAVVATFIHLFTSSRIAVVTLVFYNLNCLKDF
jgi:hypothetical protein